MDKMEQILFFSVVEPIPFILALATANAGTGICEQTFSDKKKKKKKVKYRTYRFLI